MAVLLRRSSPKLSDAQQEVFASCARPDVGFAQLHPPIENSSNFLRNDYRFIEKTTPLSSSGVEILPPEASIPNFRRKFARRDCNAASAK